MNTKKEIKEIKKINNNEIKKINNNEIKKINNNEIKKINNNEIKKVENDSNQKEEETNDSNQKEEETNDSNSSYDSSELDNEAEKLTVSKEFEENVIKFVKYDNQIRSKTADIKELKQKRKPCEEFILNYLNQINEKEIEITGGKLRRNKSETKQSVNSDIIKKTLTDKIQNPKLISDILKSLEENRPLKTHINLKRTGERKKKNKS
jgi:hypothetical protein